MWGSRMGSPSSTLNLKGKAKTAVSAQAAFRGPALFIPQQEQQQQPGAAGKPPSKGHAAPPSSRALHVAPARTPPQGPPVVPRHHKLPPRLEDAVRLPEGLLGVQEVQPVHACDLQVGDHSGMWVWRWCVAHS